MDESAAVAAAVKRLMTDQVVTGRCVCGAIQYTASNPKPIWYCHCEQCRRMTGHYMAAAQVDLDDIEIQGEPKWYYLNQTSRHGFCPDCGCQMFWRNDNNPYLSITAGCMNDSSDLPAAGHIFTAEQGQYYTVPDHELSFETYWDEAPSRVSKADD